MFLLALSFFLLMKTDQAISGTSAATYKVMEPHWKNLTLTRPNGANFYLLLALKWLALVLRSFWCRNLCTESFFATETLSIAFVLICKLCIWRQQLFLLCCKFKGSHWNLSSGTVNKMVYCCFPGCYAHSERAQYEGVTFHRFPADPARKDLWIQQINRFTLSQNKGIQSYFLYHVCDPWLVF